MAGDEYGVHACRHHPTAEWRSRLTRNHVKLCTITCGAKHQARFTQARGRIVMDRAGDHAWAWSAATSQAALLPDQRCDHEPGAVALGELRCVTQRSGPARPTLEES